MGPAYLWDHTNNKSSEIIQYNDHISSYAEKNLVGYKYYEKYNMIPLFPFGFGLSYTNYHIIPCFTYCVSHASCKIDVLVKSTHKYAGIASEVLQIYIGFITVIPTDSYPVKELR